MTSDEYSELAQTAKDALHDVIRVLEPGTGWKLHEAYMDLKDWIKRLDANNEAEAADVEAEPAADDRRDAWQREYEQRLERKRAWRETPREQKVQWILNALDDNRLTHTEIEHRVRERNPEFGYYVNTRVLVTELVRSGDLEREKEPRAEGSKAYRWRFRRRVKLSPELESLQRALDEEQS